MLHLQKTIIQKQDEDLEKLSALIRRQKDIGITISNELDLQNKMLDDLSVQVDTTESRVISSNRKLKKLQ